MTQKGLDELPREPVDFTPPEVLVGYAPTPGRVLMITLLLIAILMGVLFLNGCAKASPLLVWDHTGLSGDEFDVKVAEDAAIRRVCIQWFVQRPDAGSPEWEWRCVTVDELRLIAFPESAR
jgi:hypothetical protein